jgi:hypothetical protein
MEPRAAARSRGPHWLRESYPGVTVKLGRWRSGGKPAQQGDSAVPDQRALDALGDAVRRAREATGATAVGAPAIRVVPSHSPPRPAGTPSAAKLPDRRIEIRAPAADGPSAVGASVDAEVPSAAGLPGAAAVPRAEIAAGVPPAPPGAEDGVRWEGPVRRSPPRRLGRSWRGLPRRVAVGSSLVALAILVVAVILAVRLVGDASSPRSSTPPSTRPSSHTTSTSAPKGVSSSTRPTNTTPTTTTPPSSSTTTSTSPTTTTTLAPAPGSVPTLSTLSPSAGHAGTVVVVRGTNFFSPNGLVLARVDGQPARTNCPSQTSCTVVMPSLSGSPSSVAVTITTKAGTSNALSFGYS